MRLAACFAVPFALILYLALRGGGYDPIVRGEVGIAVGWILLLGAIVGLLPSGRIGRWGWIALGVVALLAIWTAAGIAWSESSEASIEELSRVTGFVLVLALVLSVQGRDGWRLTLLGAGAAIALIGILALGSRLVPSAFPANEAATELDVARARLNYPVNYWNGLAALLAIGLPLIAAVATDSRRTALAVLASVAIPAVALAGYYTLSRGGALEVAVGLAVLFALHPHRLAAAARLAPALAGSGALIALATQRQALENGFAGEAADDQRVQMLIAVVICSGLVGALRWVVELVAEHDAIRAPRLPSRRAALVGGSAVLLAALALAIAAGAPGEIDDGWQEFKSGAGPGEDGSRFDSASGNGRYQYWSAAVDANATDPLVGTGPGTYRYWWARAGTVPGVVHDAHSLYLQTLAEAGIIGLLIVAGAVVALLVFAFARALRAPPLARPWLAAAAASCAGFATAAAVDWVWQLTVVPVAFLCVVAAIAGSQPEGGLEHTPASPRLRLAVGAVAIAGVLIMATPLVADLLVQSSQRAAVAGDLRTALDRAQQARQVAPWAAGPRLQEALVLEAGGDLDGAADAAREATDRESTNWKPWQVLSRIEFERGDQAAGTEAYQRARSLNPRSPLFAPGSQ